MLVTANARAGRVRSYAKDLPERTNDDIDRDTEPEECEHIALHPNGKKELINIELCCHEGMQVVYLAAYFVVHIRDRAFQFDLAFPDLFHGDGVVQGVGRAALPGRSATDEHTLAHQLGLHADARKARLQGREFELANHGRLWERAGGARAQHATSWYTA